MLLRATPPRTSVLTSQRQRVVPALPALMNAGQPTRTELAVGSWRWMPEPGSDVICTPVRVNEVIDGRTRCVVIESEAGDCGTIAAEEVLSWDKVSLASMSLVDDLGRAPDGAGHRAVVNQLRRRFQKGLPYVWIGNVLLFMQPQHGVSPLCVPEDILPYQRKSSKKGEVPVHMYEVAKSAHADAVQGSSDQSILILGENGAGQSDMLKLALAFLEKSKPSRTAECHLVNALEVLHAFGAAHTGHSGDLNCFSQRWVIDISSDGSVVNAKVDICLLEKSRVTFRLPGESNFHIFHCLCAGVDETLRQSLHLPPRSKLLAGGRETSGGQGGVTHDFSRLRLYLQELGFSEDEIGALLRSVSAVVALGQLEFQTAATPSTERKSSKTAKAPSGNACTLTAEASTALEAFAVLAGCDASVARRALTLCSVGARGHSSHAEQANAHVEKKFSPLRGPMQAGRGGQSRDERPSGSGKALVEIPLTCMQASQSRDTLCRTLYMQIFEYLVNTICEKLAALPSAEREQGEQGVHGSSSRGPAHVHLIDFAGFQYSQANSLEQFCVNYVNEWLRAFFQLQLWTEMELCISEGIQLRGIELEDNSGCVKALSHDGGVLGLLEEATLAQSGSDTSFLEALQTRLRPSATDAASGNDKVSRGSEPISRVSLQLRVFEVRHYAANVTYDVTGWVAMNRDHLMPSMCQLVQGLGNPVFSQRGAAKGKGVMQVSSLRTQLAEVVATLESSHRRYVWCIRPNRGVRQEVGLPETFDGTAVLDQLQTSGLLHAIALDRMGYPHKLSVPDFIARYGALIPGARSPMEVVDAARRVGGFAPDAITLSDGQIVFRDDVLEEMEMVCQSYWCAAATSIQAAWRRHQVWAERRAYVGSFMTPTVAEQDPGQALQEAEDLLLQLRVCPPPRFFNMSVLERRFLDATEACRELLQNEIVKVSAKAASATATDSPCDDIYQLHETLRQHVMVAHRFRVPVQPEAEACLQRYKEWEQTQQLDTSLATILPLLQGGATLQEVQKAVSELAQSPLWQSCGQEAAEEAILEPCLAELGAWADSRIGVLIDEADKAPDDCSPRTNENYMHVLANRLHELQGLEQLLGTLRVLPPLKCNAAAEMERLHSARIRAATRGLEKALEHDGPVELAKRLKHACTVFSEANARTADSCSTFDIRTPRTAAAAEHDVRTLQSVPPEMRERLSNGMQGRLSQHCQEIKALTRDSQDSTHVVDFGMVPEVWIKELHHWVQLTNQIITDWKLCSSGLVKGIETAQELFAKHHEWQCLQVEQECIDALSAQILFSSGPEGLEGVVDQCLVIVKDRLGSHLGMNEIHQIMSRAIRCSVVRRMLLIMDKVPLPDAFDAEVAPAELDVFKELLPWWQHALSQGFANCPDSSSSMVRVNDFSRRCIECLEQIEVDAATVDFCKDIANADVGPSVETMLLARSAGLASKLRRDFASSLTAEQCAEKLRPAAANVLATRVEVAINFMMLSSTNEPATADDAWLNYLGLEVGSGKFTNVSFQAVHELKSWLKQWVSWGGIDHTLAERAEEALETCREWAIVERWMVAREFVRPLIEVALEKGLDKLKADCQKLVLQLVSDLCIEKSEASSKVEILVLLEGAVCTRQLLNQMNESIDAATHSDTWAIIRGIRHFGHVPRSLIAQLRRAVELLSIHPSELAESIGPCLAEAQDLLADFIRWQPYARWVEALTKLASTAAGPGALTDLYAEAQQLVRDCRPAALPEEEASEQLRNVLQGALAKRWDALSLSFKDLQLAAVDDVSSEGEIASAVAPPWHEDLQELRALHTFVEQEAPKLKLNRPEWLNEATARLDAVAAWEGRISAKHMLAELVSVVSDKAVSQVLLKVRQTHTAIVMLGWTEDEISSFIRDHSQLLPALVQRVSHAYEETCKWTRPRSSRRTPRGTPHTAGTPSRSFSPRSNSAAAMSPRRSCRLGVLQGTLQALLDAPSLRWTPALRNSAGELDFSGVPASALRELQSWVQVAALCGLQGKDVSSTSSPNDTYHPPSPVMSCRILLWQREFWRVQSMLRETLTELRQAVVQATTPEAEDFCRKVRVATRDIRLALNSFQKTFAELRPSGTVGDCDRAPELATCSLDAHIECCIAHYLSEAVCEEKLLCLHQEFKRVALPPTPGASTSQSRRRMKKLQTMAPRERLTDVPDMLRVWLAFAEEQQQVVVGTSIHEVRRRLHFSSHDVSVHASSGAASGVPYVLAACREALERLREQQTEESRPTVLVSVEEVDEEDETTTEGASPTSQRCPFAEGPLSTDECFTRLLTPTDTEEGPWPSPRENAALQAAELEAEFQEAVCGAHLKESSPAVDGFSVMPGNAVAGEDMCRPGMPMKELIIRPATPPKEAHVQESLLVEEGFTKPATPVEEVCAQESLPVEEGITRPAIPIEEPDAQGNSHTAEGITRPAIPIEEAHVQGNMLMHHEITSEAIPLKEVHALQSSPEEEGISRPAVTIDEVHALEALQEEEGITRPATPIQEIHSKESWPAEEEYITSLAVHAESITRLSPRRRGEEAGSTEEVTDSTEESKFALPMDTERSSAASPPEQAVQHILEPGVEGRDTLKLEVQAQVPVTEEQPCQTLQIIRQDWQPELSSIDSHAASDLEYFISQIREGFSSQISEAFRVIDAQVVRRELDQFDQAILDELVARVAKQTEQLNAWVRSEDPSILLANLQVEYGFSREMLELPLCDPSVDRSAIGDTIALPPISFERVQMGEADDLRLVLLVTQAEFRRAGIGDALLNSTISDACNLLQAELVWQRWCLQHEYRRRLSELVLYHDAGPMTDFVKELALELDRSLLEIGLGSDARAHEMELFDATAAALLLRQVQTSLKSIPGNADSVAYFAHIDTLHRLVRCLGPGGPWHAASAYGALRRPWAAESEAAGLLSQAQQQLLKAREIYRKHARREATCQLEQCLSSTVHSKAILELSEKAPRRVMSICPALHDSPLCKDLWIQVLGEAIAERLTKLVQELEVEEGTTEQWIELESLCKGVAQLSGNESADEGFKLLSDDLRTAQSFLQRRDAGLRRAAWRAAEEHVRLEYAKRGAGDLQEILQQAGACLETARWQVFVNKFICQQLEALFMLADESGCKVQEAELRSDLQSLLGLVNELEDGHSDVIDESRNLLQLLEEKAQRERESIFAEKAAVAAALGARSAARLAVGRLASSPPAAAEQPVLDTAEAPAGEDSDCPCTVANPSAAFSVELGSPAVDVQDTAITCAVESASIPPDTATVDVQDFLVVQDSAVVVGTEDSAAMATEELPSAPTSAVAGSAKEGTQLPPSSRSSRSGLLRSSSTRSTAVTGSEGKTAPGRRSGASGKARPHSRTATVARPAQPRGGSASPFAQSLRAPDRLSRPKR